MKRIIAAFLFLALLAAPVAAALDPYKLLGSISVLQTAGRNMCSVTSIDATRKYYLTAAHCVVKQFPGADGAVADETPNEGLTVDGHPAFVVALTVAQDMAILVVPASTRPALKMAKTPVRHLDDVVVAGHPLGWNFPTTTKGYVASPGGVFTGAYPFNRPYMILQVVGAPGNSGSSVVNAQMDIVSVIQISWGRSFEPMMGSAPYSELVAFAGRYFGRK